MRRMNGFLVVGTIALAVLVGLVVFLSYRSNRSGLAIASVSELSATKSIAPLSSISLSRLPRGSKIFFHLLASNQRCYGGVVMQVDGTSYTQMVIGGQLVRCSGESAFRPLR
jgi:hypothetical protein